MSWLSRAIEAKLRARVEATDAELLSIILNPPPGRIVRSPVVPVGEAFELPGEQFLDGLPRLIVHPEQQLHKSVLEQYQ